MINGTLFKAWTRFENIKIYVLKFSPKMISKSKIRFGVLIKLFHKLTISQEFNYSERTTGSKQTRPAHRNFDMGFERNLSFITPVFLFFFLALF